MADDSDRTDQPVDELRKGEPIYGRQRHLKLVNSRPYLLKPARLPDATTIPPRPWLYGVQLLRGFISVLVAPGGTGKSLYGMAVGAACVIKRPLFGHHVFEQVNVAYINLEDPMDELERRLAAIQIHFGISNEDLRGRYFLNSGDERDLMIAKVSDDGSEILHPDVEGLIAAIDDNNIGVLIVDPFAETHDLEENSNPQMIRAVKAWRSVARMTNCAILLIHHVRKGIATDIDAARGAKALTDSARIGLLMAPMSKVDAEEVGIEPDEAYHYVRLDNAKANMSARASRAEWFELVSIDLGNGNVSAGYPSGDHVAVIASWQPPSTFGDLSVLQCNAALDKIEAGPSPGVRYAADKRGRPKDWAGDVLVELFGVTPQRAARMINAWIANGVLVVGEYDHPEQHKLRFGVTVNAVKRPGAEGGL